MEKIHKLLDGNKTWAEGILKKDPAFFDNLSQGQTPEFMWIGCSDSRVPATEITNMQPGSIFVHRNVANLVIHTDTNMLSVVYYAVTVLKIKHIVVTGHYGCGGVEAAMTNKSYGFIDNWLTHIRDVYELNSQELDGISDPKERCRRLVELNVCQQVRNLAKVSFIQEYWQHGEYPYIHGLVYGLDNGRLNCLNISINSLAQIEAPFRTL